jgi:EAL domain-containing protein (putative c-di-GMP-specific phosphodiesterase class I)
VNASADEFELLVDPRFLRTVYQPVVDLPSGARVGAEALTRWPELEVSPAGALEHARTLGRLGELDLACLVAAIDRAVDHGLPPGFALFLNVEPSVVSPATVATLAAHAEGHGLFVAEITERSITADPAQLLRCVQLLREAGWLIALDNVGARPASMALLALIAPDVVKLDRSFVQGDPRDVPATTVTTVAAYVESSGAAVLAEGIENPRHLETALAFGATLGQGWFFSHPGELSTGPGPTRQVARLHQPPDPPGDPWELVEEYEVRTATEGLLDAISSALESRGRSIATPPVVIGVFEDGRSFTWRTAERYAALAAEGALVVAIGPGLGVGPAPGVRGAVLAADDPLRRTWVVAIVHAHYVAALVARDRGDDGPDGERRFAFVLTHDRPVVLQIARSVLQRVVARPQNSRHNDGNDLETVPGFPPPPPRSAPPGPPVAPGCHPAPRADPLDLDEFARLPED